MHKIINRGEHIITYEFVEENVNVLSVHSTHKVLPAHSLTPVTTSTATKAISKPQALICTFKSAYSHLSSNHHSISSIVERNTYHNVLQLHQGNVNSPHSD